jgi:hypothetical protein
MKIRLRLFGRPDIAMFFKNAQVYKKARQAIVDPTQSYDATLPARIFAVVDVIAPTAKPGKKKMLWLSYESNPANTSFRKLSRRF